MSDAWDGRPQSPERDGWHFVTARFGVGRVAPKLWHASIQRWELSDGSLCAPHDVATRWRSLGPCLLPDERRAALAAARREGAEAMREAVAGCVQAGPINAPWLAKIIRALPLPPPPGEPEGGA